MVEPPAREGLERTAAILPLDSEEEGRETRIPAVGSSFTDNVDTLAETGLGPDPLQVEDGVRGRGMDELVKALFTTAGADPEETAADGRLVHSVGGRSPLTAPLSRGHNPFGGRVARIESLRAALVTTLVTNAGG